MNKQILEPSENISVTAKEVREVKQTLNGKSGVICHNLGDNRAKRRAQLRADIQKQKANGNEFDRPIINNRGNAGMKVYRRMAHFYLSIGAKRHRL